MLYPLAVASATSGRFRIIIKSLLQTSNSATSNLQPLSTHNVENNQVQLKYNSMSRLVPASDEESAVMANTPSQESQESQASSQLPAVIVQESSVQGVSQEIGVSADKPSSTLTSITVLVRRPVRKEPPTPPALPDPSKGTISHPRLRTMHGDPEKVVTSVYQQLMLDQLCKYKVWGLIQAILWIADEETKGDPSTWAELRSDYRKGRHYFARFLMTLPDYVHESMIRGTFLYDCYHDRQVFTFARNFMSIRPGAGVYLNLIGQRSRKNGQPNPNAGEWMSASEIRAFLDELEGYRTDPVRRKYYDYLISPDKDQNQIKAASSPEGRYGTPRWDDLRRAWHTQYLQTPSTNPRPFRRIPAEVGLSTRDVEERVKAHISNKGTTPMHGLMNAYLTREFKPPMKIHQYIVYLAWEPEHKGVSCAEIAASVELQSYARFGGLNRSDAGGHDRRQKAAPVLSNNVHTANLKCVWDRPHVPKSVIESHTKLIERRALYTEWARIKDIVSEEQDLETKSERVEEDVQIMKEKRKNLEQENKKARADLTKKLEQQKEQASKARRLALEVTLDKVREARKRRRHARNALRAGLDDPDAPASEGLEPNVLLETETATED